MLLAEITRQGLLFAVKGHGPGGRSDVDDLIGILESIAADGKVSVQWESENNTVQRRPVPVFQRMLMNNLYVTCVETS